MQEPPTLLDEAAYHKSLIERERAVTRREEDVAAGERENLICRNLLIVFTVLVIGFLGWAGNLIGSGVWAR